jgi:hypothetical protein
MIAIRLYYVLVALWIISVVLCTFCIFDIIDVDFYIPFSAMILLYIGMRVIEFVTRRKYWT